MAHQAINHFRATLLPLLLHGFLPRMRTNRMRPIELSLPFNQLARMLASFSVRTRIVLLALIPVVGFVAHLYGQ